MKTRRYTSDVSRGILTALIVSDEVLAAVHHGLRNKDPFKDKWSNKIAGWCFNHYAKYQKAPKQLIESVFRSYAEASQDEDTVEIIDKFLANLSDDYKNQAKELNHKYWIDRASEYFGRVRLEKSLEAEQLALENADYSEALRIRQEFQKVDITANGFFNPSDPGEIRETFTYYDRDRSIVHFPGALGTFLNEHFERSGFIAFMAPEKRGKSYWLLETVWRALKARNRVLYYVLGDMSKDQVKKRLYQRMLRRPFKDMEVKIPTALSPRDRDDLQMKFKAVELKGITAKEVREAFDLLKRKTATDELKLKIECIGGKMISAGDIEQKVCQLGAEGWPPDVVVIDYADELASELADIRADKRHQVEGNWGVLRRISLTRQCLVVTATQAASSAYSTKWVMDKIDFSEDKRKHGKVTGMLGINQQPAEKKLGVYRLNWIDLREGHWTSRQVVWTAGSLAIASPAIISSF